MSGKTKNCRYRPRTSKSQDDRTCRANGFDMGIYWTLDLKTSTPVRFAKDRTGLPNRWCRKRGSVKRGHTASKGS